MISRLIVRAVFAALVAGAPLHARERNAWPFLVQQVGPDGAVQSTEVLGPLFFKQTQEDGTQSEGFRPLYLHTMEDQKQASYLLYPFFTWRRDDSYRYFSFFSLINFSHVFEPNRPGDQGFDVWPFYFSRDTGDPAESYRALFPLGGTIEHRFWQDRIHFVLFPLYAEIDRGGMHTTHAPWPFLRFINGADNHGFEFWPLFGHRGRAGDYASQFYLWPLFYKNSRNLSADQPTVNFGALPFYTCDTAPGFVDKTYAWPFFGYTHRTLPYRYDEQRYFWPLLVQGKGDQRLVNRWAPFYTHSIIKGYDKTWFLWPLVRHAQWADAGVGQEKNQFLYFLYWSQTQHSLTNPAAAPAHLTHVWPLASSWNNGAGQRQFQLLSPFEVLFPGNEPVRQVYTPLFALYRFDQKAPDDIRRSILFNLLSWRTSPGEKEFHFGPFFSLRRTTRTARLDLGLGLISWSHPAGGRRGKFALFDFRPQRDNQAIAAKSP